MNKKKLLCCLAVLILALEGAVAAAKELSHAVDSVPDAQLDPKFLETSILWVNERIGPAGRMRAWCEKQVGELWANIAQ